MKQAVLLIIKYTPNIFLTSVYVRPLPQPNKTFATLKCV